MTAKAKALQKVVAKILWDEWDPIHVNEGVPYDTVAEHAFTDEYDSYAPSLTKLILSGADRHKVADRLSNFEKTAMGLDPDHSRNREVATKLVSLAEKGSH